jgi:uncharacterized protein (UPF0332 family)
MLAHGKNDDHLAGSRMSVEPGDFLREAREQAVRAEEISLRTAVNRGYYAAYHLALSISHHCPAAPPLAEGKGEGDHQRLIRLFRSVPHKGFQGASLARQIGALLAQGRELRVKADYHLNQSVSGGDARRLIADVERLEDLVKQFAEQHIPPP